jgi:hypothetical protein
MARIAARLGVGCVLLLGQGPVRADVVQWDFDGDLESSTGQEAMAEGFAGPAAGPELTFEVLPIGGVDADVLRFGRGTYLHGKPGLPPNGGGQYVNKYTVIMDVMFPDRSPSGGWASLWQTNEANANDGDWFVNPEGGLGISGVYGDGGSPIQDGVWYRVALVVDLSAGAGTLTSFKDGVQVQQLTGQGLDGRFSLYSVNDGAIDGFWLFADENGDNAEGYINSVQFRDVAMSPADIAALGGPSAAGIPLPTDPRDCAFRSFEVRYDAAANQVTGTWLPLPGENGFQVFIGATQIGPQLPSNATSFVDTAPPASGDDVVYLLKPLRANGTVERECAAAPIDTFGCIAGLTCCVDQSARSVALAWEPPVNAAASGYRIRRDGAEIGTAGPDATSFTDSSVLTIGAHRYEVTLLSGGDPLCTVQCRATVTGVPIPAPGPCGGVVNTYNFDGDLKSGTGGRDLIAQVSPPIDPQTGTPDYSFEDADIGGQLAQVCRYSRGTFFRLFGGLGPNGGGIYTNQYTLIMDILFEAGQLDESGWGALLQTNEANANDGDWFVRASDRAVGISGNYGGLVTDDEWHRLALVVDLAAGTYTSYVDGVFAQQNVGEALDGRFALYTYNDGDFDGISIFADDSGDSSGGLVNSVQIRDVALTGAEIAALGGPSAAGIPTVPPCPSSLACSVDQAASSAKLTWIAGSGVAGTGFVIRRDGAAIATLPLGTGTYTDPGLAPGLYAYEVSVQGGAACGNLPLTCHAEVLGPRLFFDDFEAYDDDRELVQAGWEVRDVGAPVEDASWSVRNPARRANPPTLSGQPSNGKFAMSDAAYGPEPAVTNAAGSGVAYELWSPSFSTVGASQVWLHFDAAAQLNNNGDAVFQVDISADGGATWRNVLERVSPGRTLEPLPVFDDNADGLFGRVHLDLSAVAANRPAVRLCFRHLEPTRDWWIALDNVLVDQVPADPGTVEVLPVQSFAPGIPSNWLKVNGPGSDTQATWSSEDACSISLGSRGAAFPDGLDGRSLHHLDLEFALTDPSCSAAVADEYLVTPALDLSGQGRVFLSFRSAILPSLRARAEVLLSLDRGDTFLPPPVFSCNTGALTVSEEEPYYNEMVIEVPAAAGRTNVAFAFHYQGLGGGTWWAIDDVAVTGVPGQTSPLFHRGDSNNDGNHNISDPVNTLNVLFLGSGSISCQDAADSNDDGQVNISDPVNSLNVLFLGTGQVPPPAVPELGPCGPDPTPETQELGCQSYTNC